MRCHDRELDLVAAPLSDRYPTPLAAAGKDNCQVGRLRNDCAFENGLALWVAGLYVLRKRARPGVPAFSTALEGVA